MPAGRLDLGQRRRALDELQHGLVDVLVVGGGVTGAGAALDAASRGLTVGLVEQDDWAAGTSSRSSRLAHGGLRYLEQREFGLVHEALVERGLLLDKLAPHLVHPVRFVFPITKGWERPYVGAGVALYDILARFGGGETLTGHRHLSRKAALRLVPGLAPESLVGAVTYNDAQIDDARHTLAVVRTAVAHGAAAASRVVVTGFLRDGDRVVGVAATDRLSGRSLRLLARSVIAATGVWGPQTRGLLAESAAPVEVTPSKGVHLVVPRSAIESHSALITRTEKSVLFLLPWGDFWLVGTTDTPWHGTLGTDQDSVAVTDEDVAYLLEQANRWLRRPLTRDDVVGVFAGLRPLVTEDDVADTTKMSREHVVTRPAPGLVSIAGGKYTTYRVMAADVVDAAVEHLPEALRPGPSRTQGVVLVGADRFRRLWDNRHGLAAEHRLSVPTVEHLLRRHGDQAEEVLQLLVDDPFLAEPLHPAAPYLRAEVVHAGLAEGALDVVDVLHRRTRLSVEVPGGGRDVAQTVADDLAGPLGWTAEQAGDRAAAYRALPGADWSVVTRE